MDDDEAQGGNSHTNSSMELSKMHRCNLQARGLNSIVATLSIPGLIGPRS